MIFLDFIIQRIYEKKNNPESRSDLWRTHNSNGDLLAQSAWKLCPLEPIKEGPNTLG